MKDTQKDLIDSLNDFSRENRYALIDEAARKAEEALDLSKSLHYEKGSACAQLNLAACYFLKSKNHEAYPLHSIHIHFCI